VTDFLAGLYRKAIKAISEDIHPDVLSKLRVQAQGMSLEDQLEMITREAMLTFRESDLEKKVK
jgi:hypothetical protein